MIEELPKISFAYPDEHLTMRQLLWGEHFLSPGGANEVRQLVRGVELGGKTVLDVGCGMGGPAMLLAQEMNVYSLLGIDFQRKLIDMANDTATAIGLGDITDFLHVETEKWPFPDGSFDVVFSKDALYHTTDKETLCGEVFRVLKPGGHAVIADWFSTDQVPTHEFTKWKEDTAFTMVLVSLGYTVDVLTRKGFLDIITEDRCGHFAKLFREDVEKLRGPTGKQVAGVLGAKALDRLLTSWAEPCAALAEQGQLRPGTVRASKPAC